MEFDVAAKVLDAKIRQEADPIIIEQKKSHNKRLTNIAVDLLANDLDSVVQFMTPDGPYEYAIGDRLGLKYEITRDQLSALLSENEEATAIQHISRRLEQFKKHLEEEVKYKYPDLSSYDFNSIWAKCPYEIIDTLRLIADGNPPRGKCPVCEDWK